MAVRLLRRGPSKRALILAAAASWLLFCTWMFHGVLEVQLSFSSSAEVGAGEGGASPAERPCTGLLSSWCRTREAVQRAEAVRQGMLHAWGGYKAFAWGADEIHPVSKSAKTDILGGAGVRGMGVSMVDALSTLKVMGLDAQFAEGRDWVVKNLDFDKARGSVSFFETVIRILGGLASAADLSGDPALAAKAADLAQRLAPAFLAAPTGLISNVVHMPRVVPDSGHGSVILAEMGTNVLEFASVARMSGNDTLRQLAEKGLRAVHAANSKALMLESVDRRTGTETGWKRGVGAGTDSYYEYLIKYWVLGGRADEHFRARWEQATDEVLELLVVRPAGWNFSFAGDLTEGSKEPEPSLEHLRCFYPGSLALGVMSGAVSGPKAERYLEFAANMTQACFQLYNVTASGLGAERITFASTTDPSSTDIVVTDQHYLQRPEVIESIFYMWRATHDDKWRDMGWQMWSAIEKHCRVEGGFSGAHNADRAPPPLDDVTQSWFFAETLKYFYLLFAPDSALDLTKWVMNTEAHPLRAAAPKGGGALRPQLKGGIVNQRLR